MTVFGLFLTPAFYVVLRGLKRDSGERDAEQVPGQPGLAALEPE